MQGSDQDSPSAIALQWATLLSILAAIGVNAISNLFPPTGLTIGAIANTILGGVLVTPANYAFSIWGVIYLGLIAFGIYQVLPSQRYNPRLRLLRAPIFWASVFQMIWVFLFQFQRFWFSVPFMLGILLSLVIAFRRSYAQENRLSRREKWFTRIPISIYFGWISVATVVNVASALYAYNWDGFDISPIIWTVIMSLIAAAIAVVIALFYRNVAFPLVIVWALVAIAVRQATEPAIVITEIGLTIGLILLTLLTQVRFGQKLR
jgi:hypothetical protein